MTLAARAVARNGVWPIPSGVMIETRGVTGSLFLRAWHEFNGETYEIRRGVSGKVVLAIFVERGTGPWLRIRKGEWRCVATAT